MKHLILYIITLTIILPSFAQEVIEGSDYYTPPSESASNSSLSAEGGDSIDYEPSLTSKGISIIPELSLGTSVNSFGGTPVIQSWISPSLRIQPKGKFSLSVGTSIGFNSAMYIAQPESNGSSYYEKVATCQMYAMGAYDVSENFRVRGGMSVVYFPGSNSSSIEQGLKRGHVGFDYKIGEKTWISADFDFGDAMPYSSGFNTLNNTFSPSNFNMSGYHPYSMGGFNY